MKKRFMRMISMLMVLVMTLGMCVTGYAASDYVITVENSIGDKTYSAYKVFDASYDGSGNVAYTIESDSVWFELVNGTDSPFTLTASAGSSTTYVVTFEDGEEAAAWLAEQEVPSGATAAASETGTGSSIELDVGAPGYYFITTGSGTVVTLTNATPSATVIDKNWEPGGNLNKDADGGASYSIGDEIEYLITSSVPSYNGIYKVSSYTFTDTMGAGLTYVEDSVEITISGTGLSEDLTLTSEQYEVSFSGDNVLTITYYIYDENGDAVIENYPADATVTITYKALVNDAADGIDLTNDVKLSWEGTSDDGTPDPGPTTPPESGTEGHTYGFDLQKTDSNNNVLTGAEFTLYKAGDVDADGNPNYITFIYDSESDTYEVWDSVTEGETSYTITVSDGLVNIWGLGAGTYTLTETKAPDGYNILTDSIEFTITATTDSTTGEVNGWTVTVNNTIVGTGTFSDTDEHGVVASSIPTYTVVNQSGTALPGTGGIGTTIFYVVGTLLVLAAAALVVAKMRLGKTE